MYFDFEKHIFVILISIWTSHDEYDCGTCRKDSMIIWNSRIKCRVVVSFSGVLGGSGVMLPRKIFKFEDCWKCIEIVNPTTTTLFCIISNLLPCLRSHLANLLGSWGGEAYAPPCNVARTKIIKFLLRYQPEDCHIKSTLLWNIWHSL